MTVPALPQDFIGLKISTYTALSTPLFDLPFNQLFAGVVARVVSLGGELILFFRDLTVSFLHLQ